MAVLVRIPQPLQNLTGGKPEVEAEGATVAELLENLNQAFPGIRDRIVDEQGKKRRFVNIYVNDEDFQYLQQMQTPLAPGDKLSIVPAIQGGVSIGDPANLHRKFYLTFPQTLIKRPILWELMKRHDVIANIRTASVSNEIGLVALELEGPEEHVQDARAWLEGLGVNVEPVEKNVIE